MHFSFTKKLKKQPVHKSVCCAVFCFWKLEAYLLCFCLCRCFWGMVCLVGMSMFVFMLISLILKYYSYPVIVRVDQVSTHSYLKCVYTSEYWVLISLTLKYYSYPVIVRFDQVSTHTLNVNFWVAYWVLKYVHAHIPGTHSFWCMLQSTSSRFWDYHPRFLCYDDNKLRQGHKLGWCDLSIRLCSHRTAPFTLDGEVLARCKR